MSTDVEPSHYNTTECETPIGGNQDTTGRCGRPIAYCKRIRRTVEEDGPAGHHVARRAQTGEQQSAGLEQRDWHDRVASHIGFVEDECDQDNERKDQRDDWDASGGRKRVKRENDSCCLRRFVSVLQTRGLVSVKDLQALLHQCNQALQAGKGCPHHPLPACQR